MNDQTRLERLLQSENACVSMVTFEEDYALQLVRDFAFGTGRHLWMWSIVGGVRDGLIADGPIERTPSSPLRGCSAWPGSPNPPSTSCSIWLLT